MKFQLVPLRAQIQPARIRKETKNGKERILPLTEDLKDIILPLTLNKKSDELLFQSHKKKAIDDQIFQRRIFKKVLEKLGVEERVLYACRHTFGSRCINEGFTRVMTAFPYGK